MVGEGDGRICERTDVGEKGRCFLRGQACRQEEVTVSGPAWVQGSDGFICVKQTAGVPVTWGGVESGGGRGGRGGGVSGDVGPGDPVQDLAPEGEHERLSGLWLRQPPDARGPNLTPRHTPIAPPPRLLLLPGQRGVGGGGTQGGAPLGKQPNKITESPQSYIAFNSIGLSLAKNLRHWPSHTVCEN